MGPGEREKRKGHLSCSSRSAEKLVVRFAKDEANPLRRGAGKGRGLLRDPRSRGTDEILRELTQPLPFGISFSITVILSHIRRRMASARGFRGITVTEPKLRSKASQPRKISAIPSESHFTRRRLPIFCPSPERNSSSCVPTRAPPEFRMPSMRTARAGEEPIQQLPLEAQPAIELPPQPGSSKAMQCWETRGKSGSSKSDGAGCTCQPPSRKRRRTALLSEDTDMQRRCNGAAPDKLMKSEFKK